MIKKLRIKLIIASMISLLSVLFVIEGIVGILNYQKIINDSDRTLNILKENKGKFPPKNLMNTPDERPFMSSEIPYESRYFSVLFNEWGEVILTDTSKIVSINTTEAIEYGKKIWEKNAEKGFFGDYRFLRCTYENETRIIFLDCGRQLDTFQNFLFTSFGVTVLGLLAVLILMIFLSSKIVKPFSDNYDKQKRFITDAGHELKTPLTIINADTEILEMDYGENEWLKDIQEQTKRLSDLTNALIVLSRMEEGQNKTMKVDFPLSDMLEDIVGDFQAPAKLHNINMNTAIEPMVSMTGYEKEIRTLITILLDNAVKYTNDQGSIKVTLKKFKNRIHLSVFNTTEFISKDAVPYLFDRFYRTDTSRNSETGGYGLGLSVAAATVASYKGKIFAKTKDERSLEITIIFPL